MIVQPRLSRQQWVSASHFHPLSETEVLREVSSRVTAVRARTPDLRPPHPLVVFDLDSTLYEVAPRTFRIIQEWLESAESQKFKPVREALLRLRENQVGYSLKDTLRTLGLNPVMEDDVVMAWQELKAFWLERFFTSRYLPSDRPYPGAAAFAREVYGLGAEIVYLTGRDEPGMGEGTRANLARDGFPWDTERTHALLKASDEMTDLEHKKQAGAWLAGHGTLVASFENEPLNLVSLAELFPGAMHVFVETVCSDREAPVYEGLYRIKGFGGLVEEQRSN